MYGRMYISWNDFNVDGGALSVTHSDDGTTWSAPVNSLATSFIRDVQITGSPRRAPRRFEGNNSTVFVAGMDEGGGGNSTRQNIMYKSLDGGAHLDFVHHGSAIRAVGDASCASNGYFYQVNPIWRHMGWGEPAVGPKGVVHYDYAGAGTNGDHGDIFYVRSKDNGKTWSKPNETQHRYGRSVQDAVDAFPVERPEGQSHGLLVRSAQCHQRLQQRHRQGMQIRARWPAVENQWQLLAGGDHNQHRHHSGASSG